MKAIRYKQALCRVWLILISAWASAASAQHILKFDSMGLIETQPTTLQKAETIRTQIPRNILESVQNELIGKINNKWCVFIKSKGYYKDTTLIDYMPILPLVNVNGSKCNYNNSTKTFDALIKIDEDCLLNLDVRIPNYAFRNLLKAQNQLINIELNTKSKLAKGLKLLLDSDDNFNWDCSDQEFIAAWKQHFTEFAAQNVLLDTQMINILKLQFIHELLYGKIESTMNDDSAAQLNKLKMEILQAQIMEMDSMIAEDRLVLQTETASGKKTVKPDKDALEALLKRKSALRNELAELQVKMSVPPTKPAIKQTVWYTDLQVFKGQFYLGEIRRSGPDSKGQAVMMVDARNGNTTPNPPVHHNYIFRNNYNMYVNVYNLQGDSAFSLDVSKGIALPTGTAVARAIDEVPGLKEVFGFLSNFQFPTNAARLIEAIPDGFLDKDLERSRKLKTLAPDAKVCECAKTKNICINGKMVKIPECLYKNEETNVCFTNIDMQQIDLLIWYYEQGLNKLKKVNEKPLSAPAVQALVKKVDLADFANHKAQVNLKNGKANDVRTIQNITVRKTYRITAGIGFAYQFGFPYELELKDNQIQRSELNKTGLTFGAKYYPFGRTVLEENLKMSFQGRKSNKYCHPRIGNLHTKLFIYSGLTVGKNPFEHAYLGLGIEPVSGLSFMAVHRWNFANNIYSSNGNLFQAKGYSSLFAPGWFGIGVLLDPVAAVKVMGLMPDKNKKG